MLNLQFGDPLLSYPSLLPSCFPPVINMLTQHLGDTLLFSSLSVCGAVWDSVQICIGFVQPQTCYAGERFRKRLYNVQGQSKTINCSSPGPVEGRRNMMYVPPFTACW